VSLARSAEDSVERRQLVASAILMTLALSLLLALFLSVLASTFAVSLLQFRNAAVATQASLALTLIAVAAPLILLSSVVRAALEGLAAFHGVALLRILSGGLSLLLPALMAWFGASLMSVTLAILAGPLGALLLGLRLLQKRQPFSLVDAKRAQASALLSLSRWAAVSNLVGPFMMQLDRLLIGLYLPVALLPKYVAPLDVISRFGVIANALPAVLMARTGRMSPTEAEADLSVQRASQALLVGMLPLCVGAALLAPEFLQWWMSGRLGSESVVIAQLLCIGVLFNALAQPGYGILLGSARVDLAGKMHLLELVLFCCMLAYCLPHFGIVGAAMAWSGRCLLDFGLIVWLVRRYCQSARVYPTSLLLRLAAAAAMLLVLVLAQPQAGLRWLLLLPLCAYTAHIARPFIPALSK
jgi:O-antigen/teichoic acid export membrane protein